MAHRKHLEDVLRSRMIARFEYDHTQKEVSQEIGLPQSDISSSESTRQWSYPHTFHYRSLSRLECFESIGN